MKKRNLKSLKLHKESVSNLQFGTVKGGLRLTYSCFVGDNTNCGPVSNNCNTAIGCPETKSCPQTETCPPSISCPPNGIC